MKILVVSDTHRSHAAYTRMIDKEGEIDMLIHLGDVEGGEYYIEEIASCPIHMIAGNNDFFTSLPREEEFYIGNKKVFITHGHHYFVSRSLESLAAEGKRRGADIVMYGHTHKPSIEHVGDMILLNPGSIAFPRQSGRRGTYIVMEIDGHGQMNIEIKNIG